MRLQDIADHAEIRDATVVQPRRSAGSYAPVRRAEARLAWSCSRNVDADTSSSWGERCTTFRRYCLAHTCQGDNRSMALGRLIGSAVERFCDWIAPYHSKPPHAKRSNRLRPSTHRRVVFALVSDRAAHVVKCRLVGQVYGVAQQLSSLFQRQAAGQEQAGVPARLFPPLPALLDAGPHSQ